MTVEARIEHILAAPLESMGYGIVRLQLQGSHRATLEILIERLDGEPIAVRDCTLVSREASALLDVADPIKNPYMLQVSSPGLDRPLVKLGDFKRFCGHRIKFTIHEGIEGRKRFQGLLKAVTDENITLELEEELEVGKIIEISLAQIQKAKLIPDFKSTKLSREN
jgi:ribosome maturation factor RimP